MLSADIYFCNYSLLFTEAEISTNRRGNQKSCLQIPPSRLIRTRGEGPSSVTSFFVVVDSVVCLFSVC